MARWCGRRWPARSTTHRSDHDYRARSSPRGRSRRSATPLWSGPACSGGASDDEVRGPYLVPIWCRTADAARPWRSRSMLHPHVSGRGSYRWGAIRPAGIPWTASTMEGPRVPSASAAGTPRPSTPGGAGRRGPPRSIGPKRRAPTWAEQSTRATQRVKATGKDHQRTSHSRPGSPAPPPIPSGPAPTWHSRNARVPFTR
jgi:hypothetical protein